METPKDEVIQLAEEAADRALRALDKKPVVTPRIKEELLAVQVACAILAGK